MSGSAGGRGGRRVEGRVEGGGGRGRGNPGRFGRIEESDPRYREVMRRFIAWRRNQVALPFDLSSDSSEEDVLTDGSVSSEHEDPSYCVQPLSDDEVEEGKEQVSEEEKEADEGETLGSSKELPRKGDDDASPSFP